MCGATGPDLLLLLAWNLRDEIIEQMADVREWGGRFVVPVPGSRCSRDLRGAGDRGGFEIEPEPVRDERGFFARGLRPRGVGGHGIELEVVQASVSYNAARGTLRGMHLQLPPHEEAKLVRCLAGSVLRRRGRPPRRLADTAALAGGRALARSAATRSTSRLASRTAS